ncbi:MAG: amino acid carrier protein [Verrucomicrobiota bacterium]
MKRFPSCLILLTLLWAPLGSLQAQEGIQKGLDDHIDAFMGPIADFSEAVVFVEIPLFGQQVPIVLILLGGTAIALTFIFGFINIRGFGLALKTVQGKLTDPNAPGQITHFQALTAALSATVGLGNIAGVAVAIGLGGPGATFWMILLGLCGMTTKFCECTLGVKYRRVKEDGTVRGGAMYYLTDGFGDRGLKGLGLALGGIFAVMCIFGTFGAGNMFQVNQAHAQFSETFGILKSGWLFGLILAILAGAVIIGGIVSIARVTSFLVPIMCITYVITALIIILGNAGQIPAAFATIISSAFAPEAIGGGIIGVMIQGIKRAAFSNEAGFGSAPIAHSAVRTDKPASEGMVALLEPFIDTVVVCTMTALVIVITGMWQVNANLEQASVLREAAAAQANIVQEMPAGSLLKIHEKTEDGAFFQVSPIEDREVLGITGWIPASELTLREGWAGGIWVTSKAFESVFSWFPAILSIAVLAFAFSTMISWSYYGEQAVIFLFGENKGVIIGYKVIFCLMAILGAAASLGNVLRISDAAVFAMVLPNLIGVYFLLPIIKKELASFKEHAKSVK